MNNDSLPGESDQEEADIDILDDPNPLDPEKMFKAIQSCYVGIEYGVRYDRAVRFIAILGKAFNDFDNGFKNIASIADDHIVVQTLRLMLNKEKEYDDPNFNQIVNFLILLEASKDDENISDYIRHKVYVDTDEDEVAEAELTEAELTEAELTEAELTEAELTEAELTEAELTEAELTEAELTEAELTKAELTKHVVRAVAMVKSKYLDLLAVADREWTAVEIEALFNNLPSETFENYVANCNSLELRVLLTGKKLWASIQQEQEQKQLTVPDMMSLLSDWQDWIEEIVNENSTQKFVDLCNLIAIRIMNAIETKAHALYQYAAFKREVILPAYRANEDIARICGNIPKLYDLSQQSSVEELYTLLLDSGNVDVAIALYKSVTIPPRSQELTHTHFFAVLERSKVYNAEVAAALIEVVIATANDASSELDTEQLFKDFSRIVHGGESWKITVSALAKYLAPKLAESNIDWHYVNLRTCRSILNSTPEIATEDANTIIANILSKIPTDALSTIIREMTHYNNITDNSILSLHDIETFYNKNILPNLGSIDPDQLTTWICFWVKVFNLASNGSLEASWQARALQELDKINDARDLRGILIHEQFDEQGPLFVSGAIFPARLVDTWIELIRLGYNKNIADKDSYEFIKYCSQDLQNALSWPLQQVIIQKIARQACSVGVEDIKEFENFIELLHYQISFEDFQLLKMALASRLNGKSGLFDYLKSNCRANLINLEEKLVLNDAVVLESFLDLVTMYVNPAAKELQYQLRSQLFPAGEFSSAACERWMKFLGLALSRYDQLNVNQKEAFNGLTDLIIPIFAANITKLDRNIITALGSFIAHSRRRSELIPLCLQNLEAQFVAYPECFDLLDAFGSNWAGSPFLSTIDILKYYERAWTKDATSAAKSNITINLLRIYSEQDRAPLKKGQCDEIKDQIIGFLNRLEQSQQQLEIAEANVDDVISYLLKIILASGNAVPETINSIFKSQKVLEACQSFNVLSFLVNKFDVSSIFEKCHASLDIFTDHFQLDAAVLALFKRSYDTWLHVMHWDREVAKVSVKPYEAEGQLINAGMQTLLRMAEKILIAQKNQILNEAPEDQTLNELQKQPWDKDYINYFITLFDIPNDLQIASDTREKWRELFQETCSLVKNPDFALNIMRTYNQDVVANIMNLTNFIAHFPAGDQNNALRIKIILLQLETAYQLLYHPEGAALQRESFTAASKQLFTGISAMMPENESLLKFILNNMQEFCHPNGELINENLTVIAGAVLVLLCLSQSQTILADDKQILGIDQMVEEFKELFGSKMVAASATDDLALLRTKILTIVIGLIVVAENAVESLDVLWKTLDIISPTVAEWRKIIDGINLQPYANGELSVALLYKCCSDPRTALLLTADEIDKILNTPELIEASNKLRGTLRLGECSSLRDYQPISTAPQLMHEANLADWASAVHVAMLLYLRVHNEENPDHDPYNQLSADFTESEILNRSAIIRRYLLLQTGCAAAIIDLYAPSVNFAATEFVPDLKDLDLTTTRHLEGEAPQLDECLVRLCKLVLDNIKALNQDNQELISYIQHNETALCSKDLAARDVAMQAAVQTNLFKSNDIPFPAFRLLADLTQSIVRYKIKGKITTLEAIKDINLTNTAELLKNICMEIRLLFLAMADIEKLSDLPDLKTLEQRAKKIEEWQFSVILYLSQARRGYNAGPTGADTPSCTHGLVSWILMCFNGHPILGFDLHSKVREHALNLISGAFENAMKHIINSESEQDKSILLKRLYKTISIMNGANVDLLLEAPDMQETLLGGVSSAAIRAQYNTFVASGLSNLNAFIARVSELVLADSYDKNIAISAGDIAYLKWIYLSVTADSGISKKIFEQYRAIVEEYERSEKYLSAKLANALQAAKQATNSQSGLAPSADAIRKSRLAFINALTPYIALQVQSSTIATELRQQLEEKIFDFVMTEFGDATGRSKLSADRIGRMVQNAIAIQSKKIDKSI